MPTPANTTSRFIVRIQARPADLVPANDSVAGAIAEVAVANLEMVVVLAPDLGTIRPAPAANDQRPDDFAAAMRRVEQDCYAAG